MSTDGQDFRDRLPEREAGWWCWRCGWWRHDTGSHSRPSECGDCAGWSRERRLPTNTLRRVLVTLEMAR